MKYKLSELIEIIGGGTPKTKIEAYWNGDIPWLSVKDFNNDNRYVYKTEKKITKAGLENSSTTLLQPNDIIISARGTVGELAMIPFPMAFNQSCYGLRAKKGIVDSIYLYYLFKYNMHQLKMNTHGSVFDTITRSTFAGIEVDIPDFDVQSRIAKILSELDDKIEINNKINKNLEEQAQALYNELFADSSFDATLADLGIIVGGSTPSKKHPEYYTDQGIAWITPKDLSNNSSKFIYHGENDITELGLSKCSASVMPSGTVLFSSRAPIGYIAVAANPTATNQGFKSVIPNDEIGTAFVYYFLKNNLTMIESMASGSTFKEISANVMKAIPAFKPDGDKLYQFRKFCEPLFYHQQMLESENTRLAQLRDTLLPRLMSGEVDVSKIDI